MQILEATEQDFEDIYQLVANYRSVHFDVDSTRDSVRRFFRPPYFIVRGETGLLKGYAQLEASEDGRQHFRLYADETLAGNLLLQKIITEAQPENELITQVAGTDAINTSILKAARFDNYLSFQIMTRYLDNPPALPPPIDGIQLRPFVPGQDDEATYLADEQSSQAKSYYKPMRFEAWQQRMDLPHVIPDLWWLACHDDQIIGVALNQLGSEDGVGWVDHLGVLPDWRRKGIGMALLLQSFAALYEHGVRQVKLSVETQSPTNAPRLYERGGMQATQTFCYFKR